jgi:hypothetical protein
MRNLVIPIEGRAQTEKESGVLRKIFGQKMTEAAGIWKKFHNELHNLYSSPNAIIRVIKSRNMKCEEHVIRMKEKRYSRKLLV